MSAKEPHGIVDQYLSKAGMNRGHAWILFLGSVAGVFEHRSKSDEISDVHKQIAEQQVQVAVLQEQQKQGNATLSKISDDLAHLTRAFDRSGRAPARNDRGDGDGPSSKASTRADEGRILASSQ